MADIVNLNRARKKKRAEDKAKSASENRAKFGRTKGAREKERADQDARERALDNAKIDRDD
jgi:hypothetical protein